MDQFRLKLGRWTASKQRKILENFSRNCSSGSDYRHRNGPKHSQVYYTLVTSLSQLFTKFCKNTWTKEYVNCIEVDFLKTGNSFCLAVPFLSEFCLGCTILKLLDPQSWPIFPYVNPYEGLADIAMALAVCYSRAFARWQAAHDL